MSQNCSLNELNPGETAVVKELKTRGSIRRRLLDIGLVKDTKIECREEPGRRPGSLFDQRCGNRDTF